MPLIVASYGSRIIGVTDDTGAPVGVSVDSRHGGGVVIDDCTLQRVVFSGNSDMGSIIRDTTAWRIDWEGEPDEDLADLYVDGCELYEGFAFVASGTGVVSNLQVRANVLQPAEHSIRVVGVAGGRVDVSMHPGGDGSNPAGDAHTVELVDCTNVVLSGVVRGPDSDSHDAVRVEGGERVIVRADVFGTGTTRSAVNIASGDRHRVLGDLGAAADYDTAAVIDAGTGTVDQSIVD